MIRIKPADESVSERANFVAVEGNKRDAYQQHSGVAQKDDDAGEQITLTGNVALAGFQNVPSECGVEGVGGAKTQMEPSHVRSPIPNQTTDHEDDDDANGVER